MRALRRAHSCSSEFLTPECGSVSLNNVRPTELCPQVIRGLIMNPCVTEVGRSQSTLKLVR
jgi:hypothetical protein